MVESDGRLIVVLGRDPVARDDLVRELVAQGGVERSSDTVTLNGKGSLEKVRWCLPNAGSDARSLPNAAVLMLQFLLFLLVARGRQPSRCSELQAKQHQ